MRIGTVKKWKMFFLIFKFSLTSEKCQYVYCVFLGGTTMNDILATDPSTFGDVRTRAGGFLRMNIRTFTDTRNPSAVTTAPSIDALPARTR
jgi:hypothetical protein